MPSSEIRRINRRTKCRKNIGAAYVNRVRAQYPGVPGRADFCVYWFRRAHDELANGGRAGLVGTNTIRQNYSREGGLDYIVQRRRYHRSGFDTGLVGRCRRSRFHRQLD